MKKGLSILWVVLMTVLSMPLLAQRPEVSDSLEWDVTVTGNRIIKLNDANKLSTTPEVKENIIEIPAIKYTILPTRKNVNIPLKPIAPAKVNIEAKLERLYRGYLKAGYGLYFTPLIDLYYTDGRSKKGTFGFGYNHLSTAGGVSADDSIPDHFSDNKADIWGKWFFTKNALTAGAKWERNLWNYYGFNPEKYQGLEMDSIRQRLNTFSGRVGLESFFRDSTDINYEGDFAIRSTKDLFDGEETNVDVKVHGSQFMDESLIDGYFGVNYNQFISMRPDTVQNKLVKSDFDNAIVHLGGTATTEMENFRLIVGADLYNDARSGQNFHFYPKADARYIIADGLVVPFAGVKGGLTPTTYYSLTRVNPFVVPYAELRNLNNKMEVYGGVSGAISSTASFDVSVNYNKYDDFAYFINDSLFSPGNMFTIAYDNLDVLDFRGTLSFRRGEKWNIQLTGDYYKYTTYDEQYAWHQPDIKIGFNGEYNLDDKIVVSSQIYYMGRRWVKTNADHITEHAGGYVGEGIAPFSPPYIYKLEGFIDANLKAEYRYNKRLSGWLQFNNMLATKYQRFNAYPVQRFNAMMGFTYAFF